MSQVARRAIPAEVDFQRIDTIYRLTPPPVYAGLAYSLLVTYVMWSVMSPRVLIAWLLCRVLVCALRLLGTRWFLGDPLRMHRVGHWRNRYWTLLLFEGLSWSAMGILLMPHASGTVGALLFASTLVIPAIGVFTMISHFPTAIVSVSSIMLPTILFQLLTLREDVTFAVSAMLIYTMVLLYEAWRSDGRWVEMARLRFESDAVAAEGERARRLAEESSRSKSAFLANMSHEIRTPLNGMMGLTELLLCEELSPKQRSYLELSRTSSEHLLKLVEQVLDMSKINAAGMTLETAPYDLRALGDEVIAMFAGKAAERGIALRCAVDAAVPNALLGDAMRVRQVLANLIGNAIKFTSAGHVALSIERVGDIEGHSGPVSVCVAVTDTGPGIAEEKRALVFQAFAQADASTTREHGGTGLGLTISAALLKLMESSLQLDSTLGVGSRFHFTLTQQRAPERV